MSREAEASFMGKINRCGRDFETKRSYGVYRVAYIL